ncbi:MAG: enoyl-CoA hydratase [Candidatus Thiodiazotropha sp. (ex Lucinoma borealis)]|nr:enoyl-CoA hydratase [Candidatus Thiodiazotropha sp. (ex Lucinoma borealis)]
MLRKSMLFLHVVGTIMYIGTILAHIASGIIAGSNVEAVYHTAVFQETTAYFFILPGIVLKTLSGFIMFRQYKQKPMWLKIKIGLAAFLAFNAFFLLTPLMPELRMLAEESLKAGVLTEAYKAKEHTAMLVGMSNIIPLTLAIVLGVFQPRFQRKSKQPVTA